MMECIIEIIIYSYFNYLTPQYNTVGEVLGIFESYFCLVSILIVMPIIILFLLYKAYREIKTLDKNIYKKMLGVFYEDFGKKKF